MKTYFLHISNLDVWHSCLIYGFIVHTDDCQIIINNRRHASEQSNYVVVYSVMYILFQQQYH